MKRLIILCVLLATLLAACSSGPKLIASYPKQPADTPKLISPSVEVVYNAQMEMEVTDVDRAALRAEELAYAYGGYRANSQAWHSGNHRMTTVELAVPVSHYEALHSSLLELGTLTYETVTGQLIRDNTAGQTNYSYITITFSQRSFTWGAPPRITWNPLHTLQNAFTVFVGILRFTVDALIWLGIVGGPFVLILVGAWTVLRRIFR